MKKIVLFFATALVLVSCAKDENELTSAKIKAEAYMENNEEKTIWGSRTGSLITVLFEGDEVIDIFEEGFGRVQFQSVDHTPFQQGTFSGVWHGNSTGRWTAVSPASAVSSVDMSTNSNVYQVTLPTEQKTRSRVETITDEAAETTTSTTYVSPAKNSNIMIGAVSNHQTSGFLFCPICTYLYFATEDAIETVKVSVNSVSNVASDYIRTGYIAGSSSITTTGVWGSWYQFQSAIGSTSAVSGSNEVKAIGARTHRNSTVGYIREYVVCLYPGTYSGLTLTDVTNENNPVVIKSYTNAVRPKLVNVYYLGKFNRPTSGGNTK